MVPMASVRDGAPQDAKGTGALKRHDGVTNVPVDGPLRSPTDPPQQSKKRPSRRASALFIACHSMRSAAPALPPPTRAAGARRGRYRVQVLHCPWAGRAWRLQFSPGWLAGLFLGGAYPEPHTSAPIALKGIPAQHLLSPNHSQARYPALPLSPSAQPRSPDAGCRRSSFAPVRCSKQAPTHRRQRRACQSDLRLRPGLLGSSWTAPAALLVHLSAAGVLIAAATQSCRCSVRADLSDVMNGATVLWHRHLGQPARRGVRRRTTPAPILSPSAPLAPSDRSRRAPSGPRRPGPSCWPARPRHG